MPHERDWLENRFGLDVGDIEAKAFWRLGDNWLELTVRFLSPNHGTRDIKDRMCRDILTG